MNRRTSHDLIRAVFELLSVFRLKDATVPELLAINPECPPASLYRHVHLLYALHWLGERGHRRSSKNAQAKYAQVWGITRAGIIMLQAWENAEEYLRFWRQSEEL